MLLSIYLDRSKSATGSEERSKMTAISFLREGGPIMLPLLVLSLASWAVALERAWFLRRFLAQSRQLFAKASALVKQRKLDEARGLCHNVHPLVGKPYLAALDASAGATAAGGNVMAKRVERQCRETTLGLKASLWILGTIGSLSPFVGLFGTVVGIIKSFESMAATGKAGFAVVAGGLGEALIATAAGIFVAIVALSFYNYFQNWLAAIALEFRHQMEELQDLIEWP